MLASPSLVVLKSPPHLPPLQEEFEGQSPTHPATDYFVKYKAMDFDQKIDLFVQLVIIASVVYSGVSVFRATKRLWKSAVPEGTHFTDGIGIFLGQARQGIGLGLRGLSKSFFKNIRDPEVQKRLLITGSVSGLARFGYDKLTGNDEEAWSNAAKAFAFGSLCGGIRPTVPLLPGRKWANRTIVPFLQKTIPFHYIGLDLLGALSQKNLTDCRQKFGEPAGWAIAGGGVILSGAMATVLFLPFLQTWGQSQKTVLSIILISCLMESMIQRSNGKRWSDLDPGRFVGMSAWGYSVVILPSSLLQGARKINNITAAFSQTTDLWARYLFFINPSAANFSAIIGNQHWWNAQLGNFARQGTVMYASRYVQSIFGASALTSMIADETIGGASILAMNAIWRLYEGRSSMWEGELKRLIKTTDGSPTQYDKLTEFMSVKMGSLSKGVYKPSPLNLELVKEMTQKEEWEEYQIQFRNYLKYLAEKKKRGPAEEQILKAFTNDVKVSGEFAPSAPQGG